MLTYELIPITISSPYFLMDVAEITLGFPASRSLLRPYSP